MHSVESIGTEEQHDFGEVDAENPMAKGIEEEEKQGAKVTVLPIMIKSNKIMPIMEEPSSDSSKSSQFKQRDRLQSVRSSESYGFQPRESAIRRDVLLTGAAVTLATEAALIDDDRRDTD